MTGLFKGAFPKKIAAGNAGLLRRARSCDQHHWPMAAMR
jgi:hypothetical protein